MHTNAESCMEVAHWTTPMNNSTGMEAEIMAFTTAIRILHAVLLDVQAKPKAFSDPLCSREGTESVALGHPRRLPRTAFRSGKPMPK